MAVRSWSLDGKTFGLTAADAEYPMLPEGAYFRNFPIMMQAMGNDLSRIQGWHTAVSGWYGQVNTWQAQVAADRVAASASAGAAATSAAAAAASAATSDASNKLPLAGGVLTGSIVLPPGKAIGSVASGSSIVFGTSGGAQVVPVRVGTDDVLDVYVHKSGVHHARSIRCDQHGNVVLYLAGAGYFFPDGTKVTAAGGSLLVNGSPLIPGGPVSGVTTLQNAPFTLGAGQRGKLVRVSGAFTITLPAAATAGTAFSCVVSNVGTANILLDPADAETVNGVGDAVIPAGTAVLLSCDATAWYAVALGKLLAAQLVFDPTYSSSGNSVSADGRTVSRPGTGSYAKTLVSRPFAGKSIVRLICGAVGPYYAGIGIATRAVALTGPVGEDANAWGWSALTGATTHNGGSTGSLAGWGAGSVLDLAADPGAGKLWVAKDGVWLGGGNPAAATSPVWTFTPGAGWYAVVSLNLDTAFTLGTPPDVTGFTPYL